MIRRSSLLAAEIVLGLIAALMIGLGVSWWRLSQGPLELNSLKQALQSELSAARDGRPVSVERVELAWSRAGGALELHAVGVIFADRAGHQLSRFDDARVELSALALAVGKVSLERAEFTGGEVTFTRKRDGALQIAFGPPGSLPDVVVPPAHDNEPVQVRVARWLDGMEAAFRPVGPGGRLTGIGIRGAKLTIIDEAGGGLWTANDAAFQVSRTQSALVAVAEARIEGPQGLAPATLRVTTDTGFQSAIIEFGARNVRPRALLSPAMLGPFAGLDAPMTASISIGLDRRVGINSIEGDATLGRGVARMADGRFDVSGGRLHGRYDLESDELVIDQLNLAGARTRINGEIHIHQASNIMRAAPDHPAPFDMALPSLTLDAPGIFSQPIDLAAVEAAGQIDSAAHEIRFTRLSARADAAQVNVAGRVYWAAAGPEHHIYQGVAIDGGIDGEIDARTVLRLWPMGLGEGARAYLAESLVSGRVSDARVHLDVRPSDVAAPQWRDEAADIQFNLVNTEMRFIPTMSPVTNANASAVLHGNSFAMTINSARFNELNVARGIVEIPHLKPHGQPLLVNARVEGDARRLIEVLMQKPLDLRERLPVDPATVTGRGWVNLRLSRPMLPNVPIEQYRFNVDGHIDDFAANMSTRRVALSQGVLDVHGDQSVIHVTGPVRAGASDVRIAWDEYLNRQGRASSEYRITGDFDADDLVRLGYTLANYANGRIGVTISGLGRGFDVDQGNVQLDLRNASVDSPWHFWTKRIGAAASVRFDIARESPTVLAFTNLEARAAGMLAQGRVRAAVADGRIVEADMPRLAIEGRADSHVYALRAPDGGLDVRVTGALFDGQPFMDGDTPPGGRPPGSAPIVHQPSNEPLVRASIMVDRLKLRGGATLNNAHANVTVTHDALAFLSAYGSSPGGRSLTLALGARPDDPAGGVRLRAEDAGFAMRALTGTENIVGGTASGDGDWGVGPPSQSHFTLHLRDFQVVRLPAMARLLSSAGSLTGLVEMLNGDGIGFTALDAPMVYTDGHLTINEARLAGPSLGLTASGAYNLEEDNLHVAGVVVPSFGVNSMLGAVPVLGDLFVSRRGEGVVGMTYSVNGHAAEPRVGVNPLSALTPGILRRIFEPPQHRAPVVAPSAVPAAPRSAAETGTQTASLPATPAAPAP